MTYYVGLSDDPEQRRQAHGNPPDWKVRAPFATEAEARAWEKLQLSRADCKGGPGGAGWRYGYWYTITLSTRQ
jgi:hypothetical protein